MLMPSRFYDSPLDGKPRDSRFFCQDVSSHSFDDGFCRGVCVKFFAIILVVDVVPDSDELTLIVRAGEKDNSDPENLGGR